MIIYILFWLFTRFIGKQPLFAYVWYVSMWNKQNKDAILKKILNERNNALFETTKFVSPKLEFLQKVYREVR